MAVKQQKSGIAVGLNKGHVSSNPLLGDKEGHDTDTIILTESHTARRQAQNITYERSPQQENCFRQRDRKGSCWVCLFFHLHTNEGYQVSHRCSALE